MGNYAWLAVLYQFALIINETDMGGGSRYLKGYVKITCRA
jgi:hypothetical protein